MPVGRVRDTSCIAATHLEATPHSFVTTVSAPYCGAFTTTYCTLLPAYCG